MKFFGFLVWIPTLFAVPGPHFFAPYLLENPVILEAGAHNGGSTLGLLDVWPNATIYAFEPSPEVYLKLVEAVSRYPNVITYQLALGEQNGLADFYVSASKVKGEIWDAQSSLLPANDIFWNWLWPNIGLQKPIQVPVVTIDAWAKEQGISHIDMLWLDLQGIEYQVLKASPEILKTVRVMQIEFSLFPFYKGTVLYDELKEFLEENGFSELVKDEEVLGGDAIFIKRP